MSQLMCLGSIPPLGEMQVQVWTGPLDLDEADHHQCESILSDDERDRANRFRFEKDRRHFVAARGILRHLLAEHVGLCPGDVTFAYGEKGKPALSGSVGPVFNVSHSHGVGAWVFSSAGIVGVDVEWVERRVDMDRVGKRFFSTNEWASLERLPTAQRKACFFNCWTRKEAFVKALGEGLTFSLKAFDVSVGEVATLSRLEGDLNPSNWSLESFEPVEGYVGCVAYEGQAEVVYESVVSQAG